MENIVTKSIDEKLDKINKEIYKKPKSEKQQIKIYNTPTGTKTKILKRKLYSNGAVKTDLIGLIKDGKIILDRGIDKKDPDLKGIINGI